MLDFFVNAVAAVFLTAQPAPVPQTWAASSGSTIIGYSAYAGWVPFETCFNRCVTIPGQPAQLLNGELSIDDMADLEIIVYCNAKPVMRFQRFFDNKPVRFIEGDGKCGA